MKGAKQLKPVGLRHVHVGDDEIERFLLDGLDRLCDAGSACHVVALEAQEFAQRIDDDAVIVHDEYAAFLDAG